MNPSKSQTTASVRAAKRRREAGTSMVEVALVLPLLILLLFSLVEFGIAFGRYQVITNAAREGARNAILYRPNCDKANVEDEAEKVAQDYADLMGIGTPKVIVSGACGPSPTTTVTIELPVGFPILSNFGIGEKSITMRASAVMRNESQ